MGFDDDFFNPPKKITKKDMDENKKKVLRLQKEKAKEQARKQAGKKKK